MYRQWHDELPSAIEVCAVQPPGREDRLGEPALTDMRVLVDALIDASAADRAGRFALFGHSVGASVAVAFARELQVRRLPPPEHLFVSACPAPQSPEAQDNLAHLPQAELLAKITELAGTPAQVLQHPELWELFLPTLRADLALRESPCLLEPSPLALPITAYGGIDDASVTATSLSLWRRQSTGRFSMQGFAGGHFYLHSSLRPLLESLTRALLTGHESPSLLPRPQHSKDFGRSYV